MSLLIGLISTIIFIVFVYIASDDLMVTICITCIVALFIGVIYSVRGSIGQRDKAISEWKQQMKAGGCKHTGFHGNHAIPVWTCPDGTPYLQPR